MTIAINGLQLATHHDAVGELKLDLLDVFARAEFLGVSVTELAQLIDRLQNAE